MVIKAIGKDYLKEIKKLYVEEGWHLFRLWGKNENGLPGRKRSIDLIKIRKCKITFLSLPEDQ